MDVTVFSPGPGLAGGILIGLSAVLLLVANGRIAGISGIVGGLLKPSPGDVGWRLFFVFGMLIGAGIYLLLTGDLGVVPQVSMPLTVVAGLLVGIGTKLGSGCTSGHGVCGIGRLSLRSMVATIVFMLAGGITVYLIRHVIGGAA